MDVFTLYDENPEAFEDDCIVDDDSWEEELWWDDRTWHDFDLPDEVEEDEDMPEEDNVDPISAEVNSEFESFQDPSATDEKDLELN